MKTNLPACFAIFLWTYILGSPIDARASAPPELVFTQATWLSPNIIRIPFTFTGTLITVRARIDTLEGNFFFDTGANGLLLNNRYLGKPTAFGTESGGSVTGKVRVLGNPEKRYNEYNTFNSVLRLAKTIHFELKGFSDAQKVHLAGNFNNWDPTGILMNQTTNGWSIDLPLGHGKHLYKFIVDGDWMTDPANPRAESDLQGNTNSVILVR
jgi:hypothetical protein